MWSDCVAGIPSRHAPERGRPVIPKLIGRLFLATPRSGGLAPSRQPPPPEAPRGTRWLAARLSWRGAEQPTDPLLCDVLLPTAAAGLDAWGVDANDRDRYLGVIEARVRSRRNGAVWQIETVRHLEEHGLQRILALREMIRRYAEHARTGTPVHEWPVP